VGCIADAARLKILKFSSVRSATAPQCRQAAAIVCPGANSCTCPPQLRQLKALTPPIGVNRI
jgi:hypothetical protein